QRQIRGKWACSCCQLMVQEPAAPQVFDNALPDIEPEPPDIPCDARLNNKCVAWPVQDGASMFVTVGTSPPPMELN
ncbi:MAG: hypothetical protein GZ093_20445, partial [Rhodoferax sp.]|nr:hypothetical protein [Rhodoferax sp.]